MRAAMDGMHAANVTTWDMHATGIPGDATEIEHSLELLHLHCAQRNVRSRDVGRRRVGASGGSTWTSKPENNRFLDRWQLIARHEAFIQVSRKRH